MKTVEFETYKFDHIEKRAFEVLANHLIERGFLCLKEVYHVLSGIPINENRNKLNKQQMRFLLKKWQERGLVKIVRGRLFIPFSQITLELLHSLTKTDGDGNE